MCERNETFLKTRHGTKKKKRYTAIPQFVISREMCQKYWKSVRDLAKLYLLSKLSTGGNKPMKSISFTKIQQKISPGIWPCWMYRLFDDSYRDFDVLPICMADCVSLLWLTPRKFQFSHSLAFYRIPHL